MHKNLILAAFEKAMAIDRESGILSPSKSKAAEVLSDFIEREERFQFGERRLRDYFNAASQGEEIDLKQRAVRDGLSKYLGYENYRDFIVRTSEEKKDPAIETSTDSFENSRAYFLRKFFDRNRTTILIILGCIIIFLLINFFNKEKWMVWNGSQYEQTEFDSNEIQNGEILLFNRTQVERFKKVSPDCDTQFFDAEGKAKLWYGKNQKGELEYFTDLGRHPQTGKTLKPITRYMIRKYFCKGS